MTKRNIKQVDYEHLLESIAKHKASGKERLQRVEKLSKTSKNSKGKALLETHHEAWHKMHSQLVSAKVKYQVDVETWKSKQIEGDDEAMKAFVLECTDTESRLYDERLEFEKETVDPIWSLRIDLKSWIQGNSCPEEDRSAAVVVDHERILEQLKLVKEQQNRIQDILDEEYEEVHSELDAFVFESIPTETGDLTVNDRDIPQEALDLECPDGELKETALQEFLVVNDYYSSLLNQLERSNKETLRFVCNYPLTFNLLSRCIFSGIPLYISTPPLK